MLCVQHCNWLDGQADNVVCQQMCQLLCQMHHAAPAACTHVWLAQPFNLLICSQLQETQKEILVYAHEACHVFPGFEDQCEMYVNMYGPLVMGIIQQYLQPDAMCGRLGFCPLPPALP